MAKKVTKIEIWLFSLFLFVISEKARHERDNAIETLSDRNLYRLCWILLTIPVCIFRKSAVPLVLPGRRRRPSTQAPPLWAPWAARAAYRVNASTPYPTPPYTTKSSTHRDHCPQRSKSSWDSTSQHDISTTPQHTAQLPNTQWKSQPNATTAPYSQKVHEIAHRNMTFQQRLNPLPNSPLHDEKLNPSRPLPPTVKKFMR